MHTYVAGGSIDLSGSSPSQIFFRFTMTGNVSMDGTSIGNVPSRFYIPSGSSYSGFFGSTISGFTTGSPATASLRGVLLANGDFNGTATYPPFEGGSTPISIQLRRRSPTGPLVHIISNIPASGSVAVFWSTQAAINPLTPPLLTDLIEGKIFAVITTTIFPLGEISGAIQGRMVGGVATLVEPQLGTGGLDISGQALPRSNFVFTGTVNATQAMAGGLALVVPNYHWNMFGGIALEYAKAQVTTHSILAMTGGSVLEGQANSAPTMKMISSGGIDLAGLSNVARYFSSDSAGGTVLDGLGIVATNYIFGVAGGIEIEGNPIVRAGFITSGTVGTETSGLAIHVPGLFFTSSGTATPGGGAGSLRVTWSYIPYSQTNRFFVFGNGEAETDSFGAPSEGGGEISGQAEVQFCPLDCNTSSPYYKCQYVDPVSGRLRYVCARLQYINADPKSRRSGAYIAATTQCNTGQLPRTETCTSGNL